MPLGRFIKHKQQYRDKYTVDIAVHRALNVTEVSSTSSCFIKYKRGSSHHGTSLKCTIDNHTVRFDCCSFSFPCTLYYKTLATREYEPKFVSLSLNHDTTSERGHKSIGKVSLNLAEFAKDVDETGKSFQLTETLVKRKVDPIKLQLTLTMKRTSDGGQVPIDVSTAPTPSSVATPPTSPPPANPTSSAPVSVTRRSSIQSVDHSSSNSGTSTPRESMSTSLPGDIDSSASSSFSPSPRSQGSPLSTSPTRQPQFIGVMSATPPRMSNAMYRQASDTSLLNTHDIARRLASRHPELCGNSSIENGHLHHINGDNHRRTHSEMSDRNTPLPKPKSEESNRATTQSPPSDSSPEDIALRTKLIAQEQELLRLKQELAIHQQQDDERFLIDEMVIFMQPTYGLGGIPVSAFVIFRSLLHWRAFHPSNTRLLVHLTEAFDRLLTRHKADADVLLYWFSATTSLLYLFRKELQVISVGGQGSPNSESSSVKVFEGQLFSFASLFFTMYCKLLQEQLGSVIAGLITAAGEPNSQALVCWDSTGLVNILTAHCAILNNSLPFASLREQVLRQQTFYIGSRLLNAMLENGCGNKKLNLCRCAHGVGMKMMVVQLEDCVEAVPWRSEACKNNLAVARQAADVLMVNKASLVNENMRVEVCPSLSLPQLVALLQSYAPDEFDSEPVHPGVISTIQAMIPDRTYGTHPLNSPPHNHTSSPNSPHTHTNSPHNLTNSHHNDITSTHKQNNNVLVDLVGGGDELETHFSAMSTCDFSRAVIPPTIAARPGFAFLRAACTDNTPW